MLSDLPVPADPRVLVDYRDADDAGVFVIDEGTALVQTVDFFTPIVDDPDAYGRIAAANALSDVYAMGATPITALAIAGFPARDFPASTVKAIFAGGLAILRECGVALLGGHTVQDAEVKFGYAVTGLMSPRAVWTNGGARVGDALVLTKPLGTGVIATAAKFDRTDAATVAAAVASMTTTNRLAAQVLRGHGGHVHGCTDITGFGLLGHASEMAAASRVCLEIDAAALPLLPGARELALGNKTGGMTNNRGHFGRGVIVDGGVAADLAAIAFDPQTSGGLLAAVSPDIVDRVVTGLLDRGVPACVIGRVQSADEIGTLVMLR